MIDWTEALANCSVRAPAPAPSAGLPKDELLAGFHPDHAPGAMTTLSVGVSAGLRCPSALADLLQSNALVEDVDIAGALTRTTDVLVIGAGGAGCVAALTAARDGARVILATKLRMGDGNTVMAEGGIQAAVGQDDSLQRHFDDTLRAGHFRADRKLVAAMVGDGPGAIRWLIDQGMDFDLEEGDDRIGGRLLRRKPGGATAARLLSHRDYTGLELMRVIRESVLLTKRVDVFERQPTLELLTDAHGHCAGAVLLDLENRQLSMVRADATILATGGAGRLHISGFPTSNHYGATADGLALAYRIGAKLREIESFQYHPTGMAWPKHLAGMLISEAARAAGGRLLNGEGLRFVDELAPRDVVAAAILRELAEGRGVVRDGEAGVLLDTPSLEAAHPGILEKRLVTLSHLAHLAGFDPKAEPFLIRPTLHYQNGGIAIDADGRTSIEGLYCAGEVSGGLHGHNRLMGNALLELVSFGRRAGAAAARFRDEERGGAVGLLHLAAWERDLLRAGLPLDRRSPIVFPVYGNVDVLGMFRRRRAVA